MEKNAQHLLAQRRAAGMHERLCLKICDSHIEFPWPFPPNFNPQPNVYQCRFVCYRSPGYDSNFSLETLIASRLVRSPSDLGFYVACRSTASIAIATICNKRHHTKESRSANQRLNSPHLDGPSTRYGSTPPLHKSADGVENHGHKVAMGQPPIQLPWFRARHIRTFTVSKALTLRVRQGLDLMPRLDAIQCARHNIWR